MKKCILYIAFMPFSLIFGQQYNLGDAGHPLSNPVNCENLNNGPSFYDNGNTANYSANNNDSITFCPNLQMASKMTVTFANDGGQSYNIHESDTLYIYDGPTTNSPLLGKLNNSISNLGGSYAASFENLTGCLTFQFKSDDSLEAGGWLANIQCSSPPQPIEWHMEAFINNQETNSLNPPDTGSTGVCLGDSVLLVAKPLFPQSKENKGFGYSQHVDSTIKFEWSISGVNNLPNNDSVWFKPTERQGYLVELKITDKFPQSVRNYNYVFVSIKPSFEGVKTLEDTVCLGKKTRLIGGVTSTDTVGVSISGGSTPPPSSFSGLTELPDGSGVEYSDTLVLNSFEEGDTISDSTGLRKICLDIEHSYIGDLEMWVKCPNGKIALLFDGFVGNTGTFNGGESGGNSTFLGDPIDDQNGPPGDGWTYCLSSSINNVGTLSAENQAGNYIQISIPNGNNATGNSMNPNVIYKPVYSFDSLIGCPLNGNWSVHVRDNIANDNGYIFEWSLQFNESYYGNEGRYQNAVVSDYWSDDPAIISQLDTIIGQTDTLLIVSPNKSGDYSFTYNIVDNFGCKYDTTVSLYVIPKPKILEDTFTCHNLLNISGTESFNGGTWSSESPLVSFSDSLNDNTSVKVDTFGIYKLIYTDKACGFKDTVTIDFHVSPYGKIIGDNQICINTKSILSLWNEEGWIDSYLWSNGSTEESITISKGGTYTLKFINLCGEFTDSIIVTEINCDIDPPNVITPNGDGINDKWFIKNKGIKELNCQIRNRWGNVVYEFNEINGFWDGKNTQGKDLTEGIYFYNIKAIDLADRVIIENGHITIIK